MLIRYRTLNATTTAILREDNDEVIGRVRKVTETMGRGSWIFFVAFRPDGSRVGHARTLAAAAELLA